MAKLVFGNVNDIHQGIDKVALRVFDKTIGTYGGYEQPVAWNGVTAINEAPSGAETTKLYADNLNFGSLTSKEEFGLTLECYCTPAKFDACDGSTTVSGKKGFRATMQDRLKFALIYREFVDDGSREADSKEGIYHVVIGCKASPTAKDHSTVNDSPEAATLSYEISTTPEKGLFRAASGSITKISDDEIVHFTIEADASNADDVYDALYSIAGTGEQAADFAWQYNANNELDLTTLFTAANAT